MIVLHVDTGTTWRGGQAQVRHLLTHLPASVESHLLTPPESPLPDRLDHILSPRQFHTHPLRGEWDLPAAWNIASLANRAGADLLHAHSSHALGICMVARYLFSAPPLIETRRLEKEVGTNWFSRKKYTGADHHIAISRPVQSSLREAGVPADRMTIIPSGVDIESVDDTDPAPDILRALDLDPSRPVIGNVGALSRQKNQKTFIRAGSIVRSQQPEAQFLIAGEGDRREELEQLISDLNQENQIVLAGFQRNIMGLIKTFDLFVLTSIFEGLCSTLLQVMAARVPIIASPVGGVTDLIQNGRTGTHASPENPEEVAQNILRFLEEGHPDKWVQKARDLAEKHDVRQLSRKVEEVYRNVLKRDE